MNNQIPPTSIPSKKNGKIEFYRFLFCIFVLFFHIQKYILKPSLQDSGIHLAFFLHGSIGVEFFFVLSGFLMAKSVNASRSNSTKPIASRCLSFMKRKYRSVFPYHCIAFVLVFLSLILTDDSYQSQPILKLIDSIPNFFLVEMTGISFSNPNHIEWYLSCMLIAMAIIYPILLKFYDSFTHYFAPLFALLICGYIIYTTGSLTGVSVWMGICYKSLWRAMAEISLGTFAFEFSKQLSSRSFTKRSRFFLTVSEIFCLLMTTIFVMTTLPIKYEIYALIAVFFIISISFSEQSYGTKLFNHKFVYFLGKLSLPIYLAQIAAINLDIAYFYSYRFLIQMLITIVLTFLLAIPVLFLGNALLKHFVGRR